MSHWVRLEVDVVPAGSRSATGNPVALGIYLATGHKGVRAAGDCWGFGSLDRPLPDRAARFLRAWDASFEIKTTRWWPVRHAIWAWRLRAFTFTIVVSDADLPAFWRE